MASIHTLLQSSISTFRTMDVKAYAVAILIQIIYTAYFVMSKTTFTAGFSLYVFVFYRQAAATMLQLPIAFMSNRQRSPRLTFSIALKLFFHALIGITMSLNMNNIGIKYTTASVVSAASNSIPILTFFLALILRMESIKLNSLYGIIKLFGIVLCMAGVLELAFYIGPILFFSDLQENSRTISPQDHNSSSSPTSTATWIKGSFFLLSSNLAWSLWLVLQGKILDEFPSMLLFTTLQSVFSTAQCFVVALAFEREWSKWELHLNISLVAILYSGFVITGISFYLESWCVDRKGPVFAAIFTPLSLIWTIICSRVFIGEMIHLGSVIGGLLMVGGLYAFLWGKSKEDSAAASMVSNQDAGTEMEAA